MADPFQAPATSVRRPAAAPGALLLVGSAVWLVVCAWLVLTVDPGDFGAFESSTELSREQKRVIRFATMGLTMVLSALVAHGAYHMLSLGSHRAAKRACLLACVPFCGPCYLLAIPVGVWGIVVLRRPEVRRSFRDA